MGKVFAIFSDANLYINVGNFILLQFRSFWFSVRICLDKRRNFTRPLFRHFRLFYVETGSKQLAIQTRVLQSQISCSLTVVKLAILIISNVA